MARKSNFEGYHPSFEDAPEALRRAKARGAQRGFDQDFEGMRTTYEVMRQPKEPSTKDMSRRLGAADEAAADLMKRRQRDYTTMKQREGKNFRSAAETTQGAGGGRGRVNPATVEQRDAPEDEFEQLALKRGGKVSATSKRAVKGWGKARGARKAKTY